MGDDGKENGPSPALLPLPLLDTTRPRSCSRFVTLASRDASIDGPLPDDDLDCRVGKLSLRGLGLAVVTSSAVIRRARGASAESAPAPWDCVRGEDVDDVDDEAKAANDRGVGERGCEGDTHREGEAGQPTVTQPAPPHTQPSVYKGATSHRPTRHVYTTCGW